LSPLWIGYPPRATQTTRVHSRGFTRRARQ
jgi:hypothetical protein